MSDLDVALEKLTRRAFSAKVFLNGDGSNVAISYAPPNRMQISGVDPGFRLEDGGVQVYDGIQWQAVDDSQWLNILRLMDPRTYFHKVKEGLYKDLPNALREVTGVCHIGDQGYYLGDDYLDWLKARNTLEREVTFRLDPVPELVEFEQSNVPPFQDEKVTIRIER